jgi:hypothetical protein
MEPWKIRILVTGGLLGAMAGLLSAFLMVKKSEAKETKPQLNASDGAKIGIGVLGLVKLISDLGSPK